MTEIEIDIVENEIFGVISKMESTARVCISTDILRKETGSIDYLPIILEMKRIRDQLKDLVSYMVMMHSDNKREGLCTKK